MELLKIDPAELNDRINAGERWLILDVREAGELALARLPLAINIPMGDIPARIGELQPDAQIAVLCHSGGRSARVTAYLVSQGFTAVRNISGGIDRWSVEVDSAIPRY